MVSRDVLIDPLGQRVNVPFAMQTPMQRLTGRLVPDKSARPRFERIAAPPTPTPKPKPVVEKPVEVLKPPPPPKPLTIPKEIPVPKKPIPERVIGTRIIEPAPTPIRRPPPRARDEITRGITVTRREREPDVFKITGLEEVEKKAEEVATRVAETVGVAPGFKVESPFVTGAITGAVTAVPSFPRFLKTVAPSPLERLAGIPVAIPAALGFGKAIVERPLATLGETIGASVVLGGIGKIKGKVRPEVEFEVTRLKGVVEEKFVGIEKGKSIIEAGARDVTVTKLEKVKPAKEPFALEQFGEPTKAIVKEFTIKGEPTLFAAAERRILRPVKVGDAVSDFKIPKIKPSKIKSTPFKPTPPGEIKPISAAAARRAAIPAAPRPPRLLVETKIRPRPKVKEITEPVISIEEISAVSPKVFAELGLGTATLTKALTQPRALMRERARIEERTKTQEAIREQAKAKLPITLPISLTRQISAQKAVQKQAQSFQQRLRSVTRLEAAVKARPTITVPKIPRAPRRIDDIIKKKLKRPKSIFIPGIFGKVKAPKAVLAPKALGLPDVVASFARRQEKVTPIGAVGAFKRTREILVGRKPTIRRVKI